MLYTLTCLSLQNTDYPCFNYPQKAMKTVFKYIIYAIIIIGIVVASMDVFRNHPEAQFAFIFPGIFLLAFSQIMDDSIRKVSHRLRYSRSR